MNVHVQFARDLQAKEYQRVTFQAGIMELNTA